MSLLEKPFENEADPHQINQDDFLDACRILSRWQTQERFVILETGFGSGRNFLATWKAWRENPARPQQLHYLAVERNPPSVDALKKLHATWPALQSLSDTLCAIWPPLTPGFHRIFLEQGRIVLTLIFDDVSSGLQQLEAKVDAFYINTSPSCSQPETWERKIFSKLAGLATEKAGLTIFSASDTVQNALEKVGFVCESLPFPKHRKNALLATFSPRWQPSQQNTRNTKREAIVIGAGLAGSAACERLAARSWKVTLIERHARPAQEASGNLAGIFMPLISKDDNPTSRLTRAAYLFALQIWKCHGGVGTAFSGETCGVLQLARDGRHANLQRDIAQIWQYPNDFAQWLEAPAASVLLGAPATTGGWLFPQGGWANPASICEAMLAVCGERCHTCFEQSAIKLIRIKDGWQVCGVDDEVIAEAPVVILANGNDASQLTQTANLPLTSVRGQVSHFSAELMPNMQLVVCREGYVTRPMQGICSVGASYDLDDDPLLRQESQNENLMQLAQISPNTAMTFANATLNGRVGFRAVSPDRLPLVGALPDTAALADFRGDRLKDVPRLPGLYALLGYASRGIIWAPIAAELLACQLNDEPLPIAADLVNALDPARFALKASRRQKDDVGP